MKAGYERLAALDQVLARMRALSARTAIIDVEPLVARWDTGPEALDRGISLLVSRAATVPGLQVVCFATNSARQPSAVPDGAGLRVVYLASAGKPLRTSAYAGFPQPGVVVGDQVATDGILARRLGYTFLQCCSAPGHVPPGPRLLGLVGSLVRPLVFHRAG